MTMIAECRLEAAGMVRSNYANVHLRSAHLFARRVHELETEHLAAGLGPHFDEIHSSAIACVLCAMGAVEAFTAEIQFDPATHFPNAPAPLLANLDRHTPNRIQPRIVFFSRLNGREPPDFGRGVPQRWVLLKQLRNQLVHFSPEWLGEAGEHMALSASLRGQIRPSPFLPDGEQLFPRAWASYSCCYWAVTTARNFVIEWARENGWPCSFEKPVHGGAPLPEPA